MSSPLERTFEQFSLTHAAVLNGSTGAEEVDGDIYGVRTASLAPDTGNFDNTGDDFVLGAWFWTNYATVTVESGFITFDLLRLLSGYAAAGVGTGATAELARADAIADNADYFQYDQPARTVPTDPAPGTVYEMSLWDENSSNQAARPMLIRMPSRDADGTPRTLDIVLYKVILSPLSFTGPAYKDGLTVSYTGRAVLSNKDETGDVLATRTIGRLINRPA